MIHFCNIVALMQREHDNAENVMEDWILIEKKIHVDLRLRLVVPKKVSGLVSAVLKLAQLEGLTQKKCVVSL